MKYLSLLILLLATSVNAQTVKYRLACIHAEYDDPIEVVKVGELFRLVLYTQDLREEGTFTALDGNFAGQERPLNLGVYSAYCFVNHDPKLSKPYLSSPTIPLVKMVEFKNGYSGDPKATLTGTRVKLGALRYPGPGQGNAETEVCRFKWIAVAEGVQTFHVSFTGLAYPMDDTLIYQNLVRYTDVLDTRVKPSDIATTPVALTIQPR